MVTRLVIKQLYGHYNYDLDFSQNLNVKILLGPNGFGKSTILKILNNLIKCNLWYFNLIDFESIKVEFEGGHIVQIEKLSIDEPVKDINTRNITESVFYYSLCRNGELTELRSHFQLSANYILRKIRRSSTGYRSMNTMGGIDFEDYLMRYYSFEDDDALPDASKELIEFLQKNNSMYVKEQRIQYEDIDAYGRNLINKYNVDKIAEDLNELIVSYQEYFGSQCQTIDSGFVGRLLSREGKAYSKDEYDEKCKALNVVLAQYHKFGLANNLNLDYRYDEEYAPILSLYIDDMWGKVDAYKGLILRLTFLDKFLASKDLSYKHISIDTAHGLTAIDANGNIIPLHKLSSGEQNLIILYFFLLFKAKKGMCVCLDEPEISMHVAWQETMLKDLKNIAKAFGIQLVIATHSIDFINGDWDDCVDLFEAMDKKNEL